MSDEWLRDRDSKDRHTNDTATGGERLSTDAVYEMLADPRRRYVLCHLDEQDGHASLDEVAAQVAARETVDGPRERGDEREHVDEIRKTVAASLHHAHLPKLAAADVIEYDRDEGAVAPAKNAAQVQRHLDRIGRVVEAVQ